MRRCGSDSWRDTSFGEFAARLHRPAPRSMEELRVAAIALVCLIAVYATGALVSRPMAAISLPAADSDLVTIDFHSHTNASHDGRTWFTPERNRQWHQAAGFDVAYISDHFTFAGADAGVRANPPRAGEGTILLSAIECLEGGEHVNVLGVTSADYALFKGRYLAAAAVDAAIAAGRTRPVVIQTIPGPLGRVPRPGMPGVVPVAAIEIADAAPRGLSDGDRNHARILALADTLGLAIVAGTDNHGWGRTAAAWNIMRVPGWRALTPAALEDRIESAIRSDGRHAVRVIERTRPIWPTDPGARGFSGWLSIASGAPRFVGEFVWQFTATRSWSERVSWLAWLWAGVGFAFWRRTRRLGGPCRMHLRHRETCAAIARCGGAGPAGGRGTRAARARRGVLLGMVAPPRSRILRPSADDRLADPRGDAGRRRDSVWRAGWPDRRGIRRQLRRRGAGTPAGWPARRMAARSAALGRAARGRWSHPRHA